MTGFVKFIIVKLFSVLFPVLLDNTTFCFFFFFSKYNLKRFSPCNAQCKRKLMNGWKIMIRKRVCYKVETKIFPS